jgi:hypothetical protein
MSKAQGIPPIVETARIIRELATEALSDVGDTPGEPSATELLLKAITKTDASEAEACCHMGRALLCLHHSFSDPPYRYGGKYYPPVYQLIALRLGWTP